MTDTSSLRTIEQALLDDPDDLDLEVRRLTIVRRLGLVSEEQIRCAAILQDKASYRYFGDKMSEPGAPWRELELDRFQDYRRRSIAEGLATLSDKELVTVFIDWSQRSHERKINLTRSYIQSAIEWTNCPCSLHMNRAKKYVSDAANHRLWLAWAAIKVASAVSLKDKLKACKVAYRPEVIVDERVLINIMLKRPGCQNGLIRHS